MHVYGLHFARGQIELAETHDAGVIGRYEALPGADCRQVRTCRTATRPRLDFGSRIMAGADLTDRAGVDLEDGLGVLVLGSANGKHPFSHPSNARGEQPRRAHASQRSARLEG